MTFPPFRCISPSWIDRSLWHLLDFRGVICLESDWETLRHDPTKNFLKSSRATFPYPPTVNHFGFIACQRREGHDRLPYLTMAEVWLSLVWKRTRKANRLFLKVSLKRALSICNILITYCTVVPMTIPLRRQKTSKRPFEIPKIGKDQIMRNSNYLLPDPHHHAQTLTWHPLR